MFNVVFPTHFIINVNSKEFNIRGGCNLFVIIYNVYFVFRVIISSCELNVVGFVKVYKKLKNGVFWDVTACGSCKNRRNTKYFFAACVGC
jgi:hypothetical protein